MFDDPGEQMLASATDAVNALSTKASMINPPVAAFLTHAKGEFSKLVASCWRPAWFSWPGVAGPPITRSRGWRSGASFPGQGVAVGKAAECKRIRHFLPPRRPDRFCPPFDVDCPADK